MADHVIIQVRDAVITKLKAGVTAVTNRVYTSDQEPVDDSLVPFLMVELQDDSAERISVGGFGNLLEDVQASVIVHCVVKALGDVEQAAYNLRRDVETTLLSTTAGATLDGKIVNTQRLGGSPTRRSNGDYEGYAIALQFVMTIRHLESNADSFSS